MKQPFALIEFSPTTIEIDHVITNHEDNGIIFRSGVIHGTHDRFGEECHYSGVLHFSVEVNNKITVSDVEIKFSFGGDIFSRNLTADQIKTLIS